METTQINFEAMEEYMKKFGAGEITLSREYWTEGIAVIYINNPEKKNAVSGKMMCDFRRCISELEEWQEGKAILLCGKSENFCSGGDLDFARNCGTAKDGYYLSCLMQDVLRRLRNLPMLTVALVHGHVLGGGAEITVACDFIFVCDNVKLGFVQGKMGIITAWGGTTRLVQLLGERKSLELLLTSHILNAEDCLASGLATKVVNTSTRMEETLDWIRSMTKHHYTVTRTFKLATKNVTCTASFEDCLNYERELFVPLWGGFPNRQALYQNIKHKE